MNKCFQIIFLLFFSNLLCLNLSAIEIYGKARVIDGDTIEINNQKIRLLGIDAFENKQECINNNGSTYKCGEVSTSKLILIVSNQSVNCITKKKDRYRRWLATCYIGKLDIGENMVLYGYAFSFMSKKYKDTEMSAKKFKSGAWSGKFIFPWEWRKKEKNSKKL